MNELKNYIWENKIIEKGFYIKVESCFKRDYVLGAEYIKYEIKDNCLKIFKNKERNLSNLFITIAILGSGTLTIENKIVGKEDIDTPLKLFKTIEKENIFEKKIKIDDYVYDYLENCTFYLVSPYYDDNFYINKEIEKDLWK
jgi:hypothetical protein